MRKLVMVLLSASLLLGCEDEEFKTAMNADFTIEANKENSTIYLISSKNYQLKKLSNVGTAFTWNLGDGRSASGENPSISYEKAGEYTITLTVSNSNGQSATTSKNVKVLDCVLKSIAITSLNLQNSDLTAINSNTPLQLWMEITKGEEGKVYPIRENGSFDAPVILTTSKITYTSQNALPLVFQVEKDIHLNPDGFNTNFTNGVGYGINLFGSNKSLTNLISSSYFSGSNTIVSDDFSKRKFAVTSSYSGTQLSLQCELK